MSWKDISLFFKKSVVLTFWCIKCFPSTLYCLCTCISLTPLSTPKWSNPDMEADDAVLMISFILDHSPAVWSAIVCNIAVACTSEQALVLLRYHESETFGTTSVLTLRFTVYMGVFNIHVFYETKRAKFSEHNYFMSHPKYEAEKRFIQHKVRSPSFLNGHLVSGGGLQTSSISFEFQHGERRVYSHQSSLPSSTRQGCRDSTFSSSLRKFADFSTAHLSLMPPLLPRWVKASPCEDGAVLRVLVFMLLWFFTPSLNVAHHLPRRVILSRHFDRVTGQLWPLTFDPWWHSCRGHEAAADLDPEEPAKGKTWPFCTGRYRVSTHTFTVKNVHSTIVPAGLLNSYYTHTYIFYTWASFSSSFVNRFIYMV